MTDILLAKPDLSPDFIDLSVGEANIIRKNFFKYFPQLCNSNVLTLNQELSVNDLEYQPPSGFKPLVKLLEEKHKAPVVITNGAKQALAAVFYALKKRGFMSVGLQPIHWALLPPLAFSKNLGVVFREPDDDVSCFMAYLLVAPGNPNAYAPSYLDLKKIQERFNKYNSPLIHDGAYFTKSFLPEDYELGPLGNVQIFSFSKMLGISSARGGYAVCYDKDFYKDIVEYIEMDTVGVSIFSQQFIYSALKEMQNKPEDTKQFEQSNFKELKEAKLILKGISNKILEVPENIEETFNMFAWCKIIDPSAFEKAKIHIVSGELFGDSSMVRLNLGIGNDILQKCVERLNETVK